MIRVVYKITYFSKIEYPDYDGILEQEFVTDYEILDRKPLILRVDITFNLREMTGNNVFEVVRSISDFELTDIKNVLPEELYAPAKISIEALRFHLNNAKNIENKGSHPGSIPDLSIQEIIEALIPLSQTLNSL